LIAKFDSDFFCELSIMRNTLETKYARFLELEMQMTDPSMLADSSKMGAIAREHGTLSKLAHKYKRYLDLTDQVQQLKAMAKSADPEEREMAEMEIPAIEPKRDQLWDELLEMCLGGEDANRNRCIMEIRAGTGGDEAGLFAGDLYRMYKKHAEQKGWRCEVLSASPTELGGFKDITLAFEGENVFRDLAYESGGHRVQRVPETETKGRIHTSAATVAVMAEPEDIEIDLKPDDYRLDKFCASGPGGQHVNKTESAVRLTHFETGIVVQCQDEKSQHKNMAKALRELKARVYDFFKQQEDLKRSTERKTLIGSGDRSQRIRTYNFPQNRITDHRIGFQANLDSVIVGDITPLTRALIEHDRKGMRDEMGDIEV
jgi:peptide chain release factor 1